LTLPQTFGKLDRMPRAYFDANIYDHIAGGYISADEVDAVRPSLASRQIEAHLSAADVDEFFGDWEKDRPAVVRRLQVARDLVGFEGILKQPSDVLREGIEAYVAGGPAPSLTLPPDQQEIIASLLHRVAAGESSRDLDTVIAQIVGGVRAIKKKTKFDLAEARQQTLDEMKCDTISLEERRAVKFEAFWEGSAPHWAEAFATPLGLAQQCRDRGLDGLLRVRPVRLAVGAVVSLIFALVVGDGVQSRHPQQGDFYDVWHAILASVAEVFVTRDGRLAKSLGRVPIDRFRVVTSLGEVLDHR